ncbi:AraC family transcriptional regulator [Chthonobacter rhizosphaerae]|uniref:AraC family transcriptional regulator n=1 Tax=Chthonobacter rhizosphaerae TaxID=2735553 RepID=UPI0015EFD6E5|nr:AraC family transcriptional regulator [Chthonobacter rhizosphaerae]
MNKALSVTHGRFGRVNLYDLDRGYVTHAHREAQIVFHIRGQPAPLTISKAPVTLCPDHGVACNAWEPHDYAPPARFEGQRSLTLYIDTAWWEAFGGPSVGPLHFGRRHVVQTNTIERAIDRLLASMADAKSPLLFEGLVFELVGLVAEQTNARIGAVPAGRPVAFDFRVRKAIKLLSEHRGSDMDLEFVARASGMSRPNFYRLFRDQTGMTPKLYYNILRMERALQELCGTGKPITEIGLDLGFASQSSFSRFFALNSGISPSDYRNALQILH